MRMRGLVAVLAVSVATVLMTKAKALDAIGRYNVEEADFIYAVVEGVELRAHSYRPVVEGILPAVVEVHGGAWNQFDRMAGDLYNKALASSGVYIMAVDFRQGPQFQHPKASRDVAAAVRYLRLHSKRLQIDPGSIGLIGSSSGGHLALLAGLQPNDKAHLGTPLLQADGTVAAADAIDASVKYIIALWPVSDPAFRFSYAREVGRDDLIKAHNAYFGNETAMRDASIPRLLRAGESTKPVPPVQIVQPGEDRNIPRAMTFDFVAAYQDAGGSVDYHFYPGQPHAFAHRPSDATDDCIRAMHDFIQRQLFSAKP